MARVEELEGHVRRFIHAEPLSLHVETGVQRRGPPAPHADIDLAMREVRQVPFLAPLLHHVHGIVQHRLAEQPGALRHERGCARLLPHEHGQRADVVVVRVGEEDRVHGIRRQQIEPRQSFRSLGARVEAGVEDDAFAGEIEAVAVRADFDRTGQVGEGQARH